MKKRSFIIKKIISILLVTSILATLISVPVFAKPSYDEILLGSDNTGLVPYTNLFFDEDFSSFDEGTVVTKTNSSAGTTALVMDSAHTKAPVVSDNGANTITGGALKMNAKSASASDSSMYLQISNESSFIGNNVDEYITEFRFKVAALGQVSVLFRQEYCPGKTSVGPQMGINPDGKISIGSQLTSFEIAAGDWYTVKAIINIKSKTFKVYVNGLPLNSGNAVDFIEGNTDAPAPEAFNRPFMISGCSVETWYDDIRIYTEPKGRFTYTADDFSGYTEDVIYNTSERKIFAGIGTNNVGSVTKLKVSAATDNVVLESSSSMINNQFTHLKKAVVEFDFSTTDATKDHGSIWRATSANGDMIGAEIRVNNGKIYTKGYATGDKVLVDNLENNKIYHLKINLTTEGTFPISIKSTASGSTATMTEGNGFFDVYVDGECKASHLPLVYNNVAEDSKLTKIDSFGRPFWIDTNEETTTAYMDNITIYTDERETVMADIVKQFFASYPNGVIKGSTISLPTTSCINGYTVKWASSNTDVIDVSTGMVNYGEDSVTVPVTATVSDSEGEYAVSTKFNLFVPGLSLTSFTVQETNGVAVKEYFMRRSIPFAKGELFPGSELCLKEGNKMLSSDTEVLELHDDGSVKWLLVSFMLSLEANETKTLDLCPGTPATTLSYTAATGTISNSTTSVVVNKNGIASVTHDGKLLASNIRLYVKTGGVMHYMSDATVTLLKKTNSYIKVQLSGTVCDGMLGEIDITLSHSSERVQIDYRINAKKNVNVQSTGLEFGAQNTYAQGSVITNDILELNNFAIVSYDNTRFKDGVDSIHAGYTGKKSNTGYVVDSSETIRFAPIVNDVLFVDNATNAQMDYFPFYDGVARTNHLYLAFENYASALAVLKKSPNTVVPLEQYKKAGIIYTTQVSAYAQDVIETLKFGAASEKRNGRFEAGILPGTIDVGTGTIGSFYSRPGETEYNAGFGYMLSGDGSIYDMVQLSAESWADVNVYKGKYDSAVGANRNRSGQFYGDPGYFFVSHPYYGDGSGLYMAYILSGDEYMKEVFLQVADHFVKNMYVTKNVYQGVANNIPYRCAWSKDGTKAPSFSHYAESRYMITARTLYLAYMLTGDANYKTAAYDVAQWGTDKQQPNGSWPQAYFNDGKSGPFGDGILVQNDHSTGKYQSQKPFKVYIMLYGYRGISDMIHWEYDADMIETLIDFADYLCDQNEDFGPGLITPNGDVNVYKENEDNSRHMSPQSDIMAIEVLAKAYEHSKDDRHFENMLSLFQQFFSTSKGGLGFGASPIDEAGAIKSTNIGIEVNRCLTGLKSSSYLTDLILKNRDKVAALGYENLLVAFDENTHKLDSLANVIEGGYQNMSQNIYSTGDKTVLFVHNNRSVLNDKNHYNYVAEMDSPYLWQDEDLENLVTSSQKVTLRESLELKETINAAQRPVKFVSATNTETVVKITEYTKNKISLNVSGVGNHNIVIENGDFAVTKGALYDASTVKNTDGSYTVTVTSGSGTALDSDVISVPLTLGDYYLVDTFNLNNTGSLNDYTFNTAATIETVPTYKDRSLKLTPENTAVKNIDASFNAYVLSQKILIRNAVSTKKKIIDFGDLDIYLSNGKLYLNSETSSFADVVNGQWMTITALVDTKGGKCDVYVDKEKKTTLSRTFSKPNTLTFICKSGTLNINDVVVGYYSDASQADTLLTQLNGDLTSDEKAALTRLNALKKATGESEVFFDKVDEVILALNDPLLSAASKVSYIEMIDKLEDCASDPDKWLISAENFETNSDSFIINRSDKFSGLDVLSTVSAINVGDSGVLQIRYTESLDDGNGPRIITSSDFVGDNYTIEFKFMQPEKTACAHLYYAQHKLGNDISVRLRADGNNFNYFNKTQELVLLENYEANRWYKFKIHVDILTNTYDVYIDDVLLKENIPFSTLKETFIGDNLGRVFAAHASESGRANYYDDIYIYSEKLPGNRFVVQKSESSFAVKGNAAFEYAVKGNKPYLMIGVYDNNGVLKKVKVSSKTSENVMTVELPFNELENGKYTLKTFLWEKGLAIKPANAVYEEMVEISGGRLKVN